MHRGQFESLGPPKADPGEFDNMFLGQNPYPMSESWLKLKISKNNPSVLYINKESQH